MNGEEAREIEFILRFSLQSLADQRIKCSELWSVSQLKNHIHELCPSKPDVQLQRLIYAGHCLKDGQILKDVFKRSLSDESEDAGVQVIHLVCSSKTDQFKIPVNAPRASSSVETGNFDQNSPTLSAPEGIPQNLNQVYAQAYHNYLRQYYGQSQLNNRGSRVPVLARIQQQIERVNIPEDAPNVRENEHPDLLDLVYKIIRVMILLALVMYSPTERLLFVVGLICLMLYVQQRRERNNRVERESPVAQPVAGNELTNRNGSVDGANTITGETDNIPQSPWAVFWSTVVSFFSSLIPENQIPLNVN